MHGIDGSSPHMRRLCSLCEDGKRQWKIFHGEFLDASYRKTHLQCSDVVGPLLGERPYATGRIPKAHQAIMNTVLKTMQQLVSCFLQQMNLRSSVSSKKKHTTAFHSNYIPVLHRFWDIVRYWSKITDLNLPHLCLAPPLWVIPLEFCQRFSASEY